MKRKNLETTYILWISNITVRNKAAFRSFRVEIGPERLPELKLQGQKKQPYRALA